MTETRFFPAPVQEKAPRPASVRASAVLPTRVHFAGGLTPFATAKNFALRADTSVAPFLRLVCEDLELAFVLIDPFSLMEEYKPEFFETDIEELKLKPDDKPLVLSIVNLSRGVEQATANFAGPLLINPATGEGRQVVLVNAGRYSVRHRLLQS